MGMQLGSKSSRRVHPEMNVTPLVDVVLVLLIIFMVLAPVLAKSFQVRVPPKDKTDQALDEATSDDVPVVLQVAEDGVFMLNEVEVKGNEFPARLRRVFNARPDNTLYLDADDETAYRDVIVGMDLARQGSAFPIVMLTSKLGRSK